MPENNEATREQLAEAMIDSWDMADLTRWVKERLDEDFRNSNLEFQECWKIYMEDPNDLV